jgi:hypothetical protein
VLQRVEQFHVVDEPQREIRDDLPPGFYRELCRGPAQCAGAPATFSLEERHDQVLDVPKRAQGRNAEILQRVQSGRRHEARARHRRVTRTNGGAKAASARALGELP